MSYRASFAGGSAGAPPSASQKEAGSAPCATSAAGGAPSNFESCAAQRCAALLYSSCARAPTHTYSAWGSSPSCGATWSTKAERVSSSDELSSPSIGRATGAPYHGDMRYSRSGAIGF